MSAPRHRQLDDRRDQVPQVALRHPFVVVYAPRRHPAVSRPLALYALYFCCHALTSLLCIGVFSMVDDGEGRY